MSTARPSTAARFRGATMSLAGRELKRFIRQRNRVFGALAQPVLFWALFGAGLSGSFRAGENGGIGYLEYFFPGTVVLILLFTAIFATISIIEDRNEGFLQAVLVAPVPRSSIVAGKLLGTTVLAVGQGTLVLLLAPMAGLDLSMTEFLLAVVMMTVIAFGLAGLGFSIAWNMDSTQGFHAIMTAFLMPMWFLSGSFFPTEGVPGWLGWLMRINPLTYGMAAFRRILYLDNPEAVAGLPSLGFSLVVTVVFLIATFLLAIRSAQESTRAA